MTKKNHRKNPYADHRVFKRANLALEIDEALRDPDDIILDTIKAWVRRMNSDQLIAMWRWIMLEFMQRCREEGKGV